MDREEIKLYLRVDGPEDDSLITALQMSAEEYLINEGVNEDYTKELYKLAIKLLVAHWYEYRALVIIGDNCMHKLSYSLDAIIAQLKNT